jgi:hypothetical protein
MKKSEFFDWCVRHHLETTRDIVAIIPVSGQTVRNWMKKLPDDDDLAPWVAYACHYYDVTAGETGDLAPSAIPSMTVSELKEWQTGHGFKTYKATGDIFGIKRQAVHNWHKRGKFPRWLALACAGYDLSLQSKAKPRRKTAA